MSRRPSKGPLGAVVAFFSSFGLSCALLLCLFLLTLFGTLEQVEFGLHDVQKRYFESWFVVHRVYGVPLPLPGGALCMGLLAVNLLLGGLVRIRKTWSTAGIIVAHVGIVMMLAAGLVKLVASQDGHLRLYEGQTSDQFVDYYKWEVAVWDASQVADVEETLVPHEDVVSCRGPRGRTFSSDELPFELTLSHFLVNGDVLPKGPNWQASSPVVDGYALLERQPEQQAEANAAALFAVARDRATGERSEGLLGAFAKYPWTVQSGGRTWAVSLRHCRYNMPFAVQLVKFTKEEHPGMTMARSYMSDVVKIEGGSEQPIRIQMNEPLRQEGVVLFQADYGPKIDQGEPPGPPYSVFAVVRNPSDNWPLISCVVIGVGLLFAFLVKLFKFLGLQRQRSERAVRAARPESVPSPGNLAQPVIKSVVKS